MEKLRYGKLMLLNVSNSKLIYLSNGMNLSSNILISKRLRSTIVKGSA